MTALITKDPAVLVLEDGTRHLGRAYGARGTTLGEVVFSLVVASTSLSATRTALSVCGVATKYSGRGSRAVERP